MSVLHYFSKPVLVLFIAFVVVINCYPQNNIGFPDEPEGEDADNRQGFRPRPGANVRPNDGNNFRPTNSRPQRPGSNVQNSGVQGGSGVQLTSGQGQNPVINPSTNETTTRVPPRDPSNRIVFAVSCPCQFTRQYAPVCGTDGQTYGNLGVLNCAQQCGSGVQVFLMGACGRNNG